MTATTPPARYGAVEGALASGFATAELHHLPGHDPADFRGADRRGPSLFLLRKLFSDFGVWYLASLGVVAVGFALVALPALS